VPVRSLLVPDFHIAFVFHASKLRDQASRSKRPIWGVPERDEECPASTPGYRLPPAAAESPLYRAVTSTPRMSARSRSHAIGKTHGPLGMTA
jgi:hypothetical protein